MPANPWRTWANLLTATRFLLVVPSVVAILNAYWVSAFLIFAVAVITDILDGYLARKLDQTSALGGLLDHATDALYVTLTCWALAEVGLVNPYLCWTIAAAFIQYALDSKALAGRALRTSSIGKANGVAYFVVVGVAVGANALDAKFLLPLLTVFAWTLIATTVLSMLDRALALLRLRTPRDRVR